MKLRDKKTGEIIEDAQYRTYSTADGFGIQTPTEEYFYKSLKEFFEDWEDYTYQEPLIKDEKIRKAVRAWAESNGFTKFKFMEWADNRWCLSTEKEDGQVFDIDFFDNDCKKLPKFVYDTFYTIAELCGDEE